MEFTTSEIKELSKPNQIITIEGINYLGQEFRVSGTPLGRGYIDSDTIGLYLGQLERRNGRTSVNYLTFFNTLENASSHRLYIGNIFDENHNLIYSNEDYGKIAVTTKNYGKNYFSKSDMKIENTGLEQFIAKPVIIGTLQTAIKSVRKSPNGEFVLECSDGTMSSVMVINSASEISIDKTASNKLGITENENEA